MVKNCPPGPLPNTTPKPRWDPGAAVGVGVGAVEGLVNELVGGFAELIPVGLGTCPDGLVVHAAASTTRVTKAKRDVTESITGTSPIGHEIPLAESPCRPT
jgi:hypothetical protein